MNGLDRPKGQDVGRLEDEDIHVRSRSSVTRSGAPRHFDEDGLGARHSLPNLTGYHREPSVFKSSLYEN
jgi:hypothetical protein